MSLSDKASVCLAGVISLLQTRSFLLIQGTLSRHVEVALGRSVPHFFALVSAISELKMGT